MDDRRHYSVSCYKPGSRSSVELWGVEAYLQVVVVPPVVAGQPHHLAVVEQHRHLVEEEQRPHLAEEEQHQHLRGVEAMRQGSSAQPPS